MIVLISSIIICSVVIGKKIDPEKLMELLFYFGLIVAVFVVFDAITHVFSKSLMGIYIESAQQIRRRSPSSSLGLFVATGHTAGFLVCGFGAFLFMKKRQSYLLIFKILIVALYATAFFYTRKRGFAVDLIVIAIVFLYIGLVVKYKKNSARLPVRYILIPIGIILLFVVLYFTVPVFRESLYLFALRFVTEDSTGSGRLQLYQLAFRYFRQHPLQGIGWGNYRALTEGLFYNGTKMETHNVYIQLACETGIFGALAFVFAAFAVLFRTIKKYRTSLLEGRSVQTRLYGFSLFQQMLFLTYAFTGNPLYDYNFLVIYFLGIAFIGFKAEAESASVDLQRSMAE
ncbi:MAG: O-antigen ligase family protein [Clostridia bacterium]|nr:O-antigen ligase family protein [Clostridia bacterium]